MEQGTRTWVDEMMQFWVKVSSKEGRKKTQLNNVNIQSPKSQECETWRTPPQT